MCRTESQSAALGARRELVWDFRRERSDLMKLGDYYEGHYRGYYAHLAPGTARG